MLQVGGAGEWSLNVAHSLHQSLSCFCHLLHLHVVQQPPLFFTGHAWIKQQHREQFIPVVFLEQCLLLTASVYELRVVNTPQMSSF